MAATPSTGRRAFPQRVGRYELLLPLGTGGTATVYLAVTELLSGVHREVAVKLMHPQLDADDGAWVEQLLEEARIVAAIRHPNVVPILEVGDDPYGAFLVMEYVPGDTLSGLVRAMVAEEGTVPLPITGRILSDALLGLHAAHELCDSQGTPLGLVHRDFSPQNILVGSDGLTRLTDFGIAKVTGRMTRTATGFIKGKVAYMSPEQALGEPLDRRADVWAAGVVAWELLTGRRLYDKREDAATLLQIVTDDPPPLREVRPDVPEACAEVIAKALQRDRAERHESARQLRDELMQAWRAECGIAESDEVGQFVRRASGEKLAERQRRAQEVRAMRKKVRSGGSVPDVEATDTPDETARSEVTTTKSWSHGRAAFEATRARWMRRVTVISLGGALLAAYFFWLGSERSSAPSMVAATTFVPPALTVPNADLALAPKEREASEERSPDLRWVAFEANAPISGLSVDGKSVYVAEPSERVEVQLPKTHGASPVVAKAVDGRTVRAKLRADQAELALSFPLGRAPAARTPALRKPVVPRKQAPESSQTEKSRPPELAPPPYQ